MVHLCDQVLAALDTTGPRSTPEVMRAIGAGPHRAQMVWRALDWLERHGQVVRAPMPESRTMHWLRVNPPPTVDPVDLTQEGPTGEQDRMD